MQVVIFSILTQLKHNHFCVTSIFVEVLSWNLDGTKFFKYKNGDSLPLRIVVPAQFKAIIMIKCFLDLNRLNLYKKRPIFPQLMQILKYRTTVVQGFVRK